MAAGEGALDLVFIPGFVSHVEHFWDEPGLAAFFERLGRFARVIVMDRRGCGLSDPRAPGLTLDDEARDVLAVLDAAGRERVQALVLYAAMVSMLGDDELVWANTPEQSDATWVDMAERWGTGANLGI